MIFKFFRENRINVFSHFFMHRLFEDSYKTLKKNYYYLPTIYYYFDWAYFLKYFTYCLCTFLWKIFFFENF